MVAHTYSEVEIAYGPTLKLSFKPPHTRRAMHAKYYSCI